MQVEAACPFLLEGSQWWPKGFPWIAVDGVTRLPVFTQSVKLRCEMLPETCKNDTHAPHRVDLPSPPLHPPVPPLSPSVALMTQAMTHQTHDHLPTARPMLGSNNWLSECGVVNESSLLAQARAQQKQLLPAGYDMFGLDSAWSHCASGDCPGASPNRSDPNCCGVGHGMDEYGRPLPRPDMFPSSGPNGSLGFTQIASQLHAMGLRFQLRMERGIPIEAVQARTKVLGTNFTADQIVNPNASCGKWGVLSGWSGVFMGVNTSHPGGRAYIQSVVDQVGGSGWVVHGWMMLCVHTYFIVLSSKNRYCGLDTGEIWFIGIFTHLFLFG